MQQFLIVRSRQPRNVYGPFLAELLRHEGLNGVVTVDVDHTAWPSTEPGDLLILSPCQLRRAEIDDLHGRVRAGLRLAAILPPPELATALGWTPDLTVNKPGWLLPSGDSEALQTHVAIDHCRYAGDATAVTELAASCDAEWTPTGYTAAARQSLGAGQVAMFFYDLGKAVARLRFGDPELAAHLTTGAWDWQHAIDLYADYVDPRVIGIPQADRHSQLLAAALTDLVAAPLARLWYYELAETRCAGIMSSDDDWSTPEQFTALNASLKRNDGHCTFYLVEKTLLPDEMKAEMARDGHSFGPHVNARGMAETQYFAFPEALRRETAGYRARYDELSLSLQCHCAPWSDYMEWLPDFQAAGYRMLLAYITHPDDLGGYMIGSSHAVKFCDLNGQVHDCWQLPIIAYDDATLIERIPKELDGLLATVSERIALAQERDYGPLSVASHPVSFATYSEPYIDGCLRLIHESGSPILSADEWCEFSDRRHAVQLAQREEEDGRVVVSVTGLVGAITVLLPTADGAVTVDGVATEPLACERFGRPTLAVAIRAAAADVVTEITCTRRI